MSRTLFLSAVASAAILAAPVVAQTPASTQDFLNKAAPSNQFEIESSELALERADDDDVRAFAERMIEDHTTAAERMQLAVSEDESVEMPPATLDEKHQALVDELSNLEGDDFDERYTEMQIQAHEEAVTLFSEFIESGEDGPVKLAAEKLLPTLEQHHTMVEEME